MNKQELVKEYVKCHKDTEYALATYLETYDNTQNRHVPFQLFPEQTKMVKDFEKYNENIVLKYRQAGCPQLRQLGFLKNYNLHLQKNQKKF